jgi:hypothetical protein
MLHLTTFIYVAFNDDYLLMLHLTTCIYLLQLTTLIIYVAFNDVYLFMLHVTMFIYVVCYDLNLCCISVAFNDV